MTIRPFIWLLLSSMFAVSCQTADKSKSLSIGQFVKQDDVSDALAQAENLHTAGDVEGAISVLKTLTDKPYHAGHDRAYELQVEWLLQINKTSEAKGVASYFMRTHKESPSIKKIVDLFAAQKSVTEPVKTSTESTPESPMSIEAEPEVNDQFSDEAPNTENKTSEQESGKQDLTSSLDLKKNFNLRMISQPTFSMTHPLAT